MIRNLIFNKHFGKYAVLAGMVTGMFACGEDTGVNSLSDEAPVSSSSSSLSLSSEGVPSSSAKEKSSSSVAIVENRLDTAWILEQKFGDGWRSDHVLHLNPYNWEQRYADFAFNEYKLYKSTVRHAIDIYCQGSDLLQITGTVINAQAHHYFIGNDVVDTQENKDLTWPHTHWFWKTDTIRTLDIIREIVKEQIAPNYTDGPDGAKFQDFAYMLFVKRDGEDFVNYSKLVRCSQDFPELCDERIAGNIIGARVQLTLCKEDEAYGGGLVESNLGWRQIDAIRVR